MDHICEPNEGWPKEVPYLFDSLCPYLYDNENWEEFPQRMGWTCSELLEFQKGSASEILGHNSKRAASLLQA